MKYLRMSRTALFALALAFVHHAQAEDQEIRAAARRYLEAAPMKWMLDETYAELARQYPGDEPPQFIADLRSAISLERMEQIALAAMVKTFTTAELNVLADFYSSEHGASAMAKFGTYMVEVMPSIEQEFRRASAEIQARKTK